MMGPSFGGICSAAGRRRGTGMRRWACSALLARGLHSRRVATILALLCAVLALVAAVWPPGPVVSAAPAAGALTAADAESAQAVAAACGPGPHFRVLTLMQLDGRQLASVTAQSGATLVSLDFGTG